jgi:ATP-dependent helicase/nuclease subunit B
VAAILPCFRLAQARLRPDTHAPDLLRRMTDTEWDGLEAFAQTLMAALKPISNNESAGLAEQISALQACLDALAPRGAETLAEDDALDALLQALRDDAVHHPGGTLRDALPALRWALTQETLRPPFLPGVRLSIYGLAEARMVEADLLVLGGLNENIWPAAVDAGPWLNRAMRESVGLAQPERDIGLTAHDFVQLASAPNVLLTWARRLGPAPVTPSRFVLRLEALLALMGEEDKAHHDSRLPSLAAALDAPRGATRFTVPRPAPPPVLRPTRFAVTAIEKLIRDPYAIFSQRVLKLEPLPPLGAAPEPRLRGNLFHAALAAWMRAQQAGGAPTLETLVAEGGRAFAPYMTEPEVRQFWWPRFKRIAAECVTDDQSRRADVSRSLVEIKGAMTLDIAGVPHEIQARADRIDETRGGAVRFIDYKGSTAPTAKMVKAGLSPQLTLEAAILAHGGYPADLPDTVDDLVYILLKGGSPAMEGRSLADALRKEGTTIAAQVAEHKEGLLKLLSRYQHKDQPYLPRTTVFKEQETSDYDHLSRFAEWARGG